MFSFFVAQTCWELKGNEEMAGTEDTTDIHTES